MDRPPVDADALLLAAHGVVALALFGLALATFLAGNERSGAFRALVGVLVLVLGGGLYANRKGL